MDCEAAQLCKVILESEDVRPAWMREYALGRVEWTLDHAESEKRERNFGVSVRHSWLEGLVALGEQELLADKPELHRRRVDFFDQLERMTIIRETCVLELELCTCFACLLAGALACAGASGRRATLLVCVDSSFFDAGVKHPLSTSPLTRASWSALRLSTCLPLVLLPHFLCGADTTCSRRGTLPQSPSRAPSSPSLRVSSDWLAER